MRRILCRRQCFSCLAEQLIHLYIPETELLANINWVDANQGLSGTVKDTTGGGPDTQFSVAQNGFYKVSFNDVTLTYDVALEPVPASQ